MLTLDNKIESSQIKLSSDINRSSFSVILDKNKEKVLLQKHPIAEHNINKNYAFAGNWDLPGGGENNRRNKSEPIDINNIGHIDPKLVALRETKEEINYEPKLNNSPFLIGTTPGDKIHQVHYYEGEMLVDDEQIISNFVPSPEASEIGWFTYNEAVKLLAEPETPFSKHIEAITLLFAIKEGLFNLTELPILKIQKGPYGHQSIIDDFFNENPSLIKGFDIGLVKKILKNIKFH